MIDKDFIKGSATFGLGYATARVLGLLFFIIVARICIPEDYGYIKYSIAVAGIAGVALVSQGTTLARYLGKYKGNKEIENQYFSNIVIAVLITLFIVVLVLFIILYIVNKLHVGIFLVVIGTTISEIYYGLLRGFIFYIRLTLFLIGTNVVKIVLILLIFYTGYYQPQLVLAIFGLSCIVPLLFMELKNPSPVSFKIKTVSKETLKELGKFSVPIIVASYAYSLITSFDTICIEHYLGMYEVGIYSVAKTLGQIFVFVPLAINTILMPKVAGFNEKKEIKRYLKLSLVLVISASLVLLSGIFIFQRELIELIFTAKYLEASAVLVIYSMGMVFYSIYSTAGNVLIGVGKPKIYMDTSLICAMINVIGNLYAVPRWGIYGAGIIFMISYLIALISLFIITLLRYKRYTKEESK